VLFWRASLEHVGFWRTSDSNYSTNENIQEEMVAIPNAVESSGKVGTERLSW
jgi:hypothetical protein